MTDLPFEHDSVELIDACVQALASIGPCEPAAVREKSPRTEETLFRAAAALQPLDGTSAPVMGRPTETAEEEIYAWEIPPGHVFAADAETISRAVERDARRYE